MKYDDAALTSLTALNKPEGFVQHSFERTFAVDRPISVVWDWLNRTETFTKGQIPPYRVEFIPDAFEVGVLTSHHGPGISFSGVISAMDAPYYRDLQYFYGSYALSFRWIRPTRLEFWLEETGVGTTVKLKVSSWVRRGLHRFWTLGQTLFWPLFGVALRAIPKSLPPAPEASS